MNSQAETFFSIYAKSRQKKCLFSKTLICVCFGFSTLSFFAIVFYIVANGVSHISSDFFSSKTSISILPELINTLYVEILALVFALPVGISTAIYLTQYRKQSNRILIKLINFSTKILASIPSILFGLIGYNLFCLKLGLMCSILSGSLTMALCVLPTIVQTAKNALNSVPESFQQAALAVGASKLRTIFNIVVPCAAPGILTGIILAAGKIVGESAALVLTIGTATTFPKNIFSHMLSSGRTLSLHLYFIAGNSSTSNSMHMCFAIATVLLALTLILNFTAKALTKHFTKT